MGLVESLGGNMEAFDMLRLCLEFLTLSDLMSIRAVNRDFRKLSRSIICSKQWLGQAANLEAIQQACWADGTFTQRKFGHTALSDVFCVCIEGNVLASGGFDERARLWHLQNHETISLLHSAPVLSVALHGDHLATGCVHGVVRLFSVGTGTLLCKVHSLPPQT